MPIAPPAHDVARIADARRTATAVLIVDDEPVMRDVLARVFGSFGFVVETAASGVEALDALRARRFGLMICDHQMPGLTGAQTVPAALELDPDLAIIMVTGANDARVATEVLKLGALDYVMKPFEHETLRLTAERALHRRELSIKQRGIERVIREEVLVRTEELEREKLALRSLTIGVAETLINAMEAKDIYLRGHSQRVADLAASLGSELGLDDDTIEHLRLAGRLHDVGKIGIREEILNKPGKLTAEEYEHIKGHVRIGMEILAPLTHIGQSMQYVHDHHEHWNGRGYPRGIAGEEISIGGRILAACDTFDALTSRRAYREPMQKDETIEFMRDLVGQHLHPDVFAALEKVVLGSRALHFLDEHHG